MRRIFGAKKAQAPPPTLDETTDRLTGRGDKWVQSWGLPLAAAQQQGCPHAGNLELMSSTHAQWQLFFVWPSGFPAGAPAPVSLHLPHTTYPEIVNAHAQA